MYLNLYLVPILFDPTTFSIEPSSVAFIIPEFRLLLVPLFYKKGR